MDIGTRFRATQDYAQALGFVGGFPNFYQADNSIGTVYGTVLLNIGPSNAVRRSVLASFLGYPDPKDVSLRFRGTQDYAIAQGFVVASQLSMIMS
jgi:hypothetical protein